MFSVNPSTPTDPSFYPRCGTDRASDRDQGSRSIIAKLHFLRVCCSIAASYHLPLHLSPSDGLHIEVGLAPPIQKLLHTVDMLCIDYYEARQRKNRANSWNDCHSRVEVSRQQAQKKICLDFERAFFNASVWLQAGQYLALAAQIPAKQKSGCPRLRHLRGGDFATRHATPPGATLAVLKPNSPGERKAPSTATRSAPGGR